jgi:hypothetical protein
MFLIGLDGHGFRNAVWPEAACIVTHMSRHAKVPPDSGPWWHQAVVYQVYPRSFADASGNGVGDLRGVIDRLDYLEWLGVDAVWLSPVFRSPMADFGYDISDHCDIDPLFGTLADADELIAEAHRRDIKVMFDVVLPHTSDQHRWFQQSRASRGSLYRDFYVWRDGPTPGSAAGGPPNNWQAGFPRGAIAWTFDEQTGQWYLHSHLPEQPDLNWDNPAVADAQEQVLRFWLDRGIDGVVRFVLDGAGAAVFVVAATTPEGVDLFLVDAGQPGVHTVAMDTLDLSRSAAVVSFGDAPATRLTTGGTAGTVVLPALDFAAVALAAEQLGGAHACLDRAVGYVTERWQFGRPIGSFQAVKHACADLLVLVETSRSAVVRAVEAEGNADALAEAASVAQAWCSEAYRTVTAESLHLHGGIGFTWEHDAHLYFRRARADAVLLGGAAHHRERLAQLLGW